MPSDLSISPIDNERAAEECDGSSNRPQICLTLFPPTVFEIGAGFQHIVDLAERDPVLLGADANLINQFHVAVNLNVAVTKELLSDSQRMCLPSNLVGSEARSHGGPST